MTTKLEQAAQNIVNYSESREALAEQRSDSERMEPVALIEECREALAQEFLAYCTEQAEQEPVDGVLPCPFCGDSKPTVFEGSTFRWRVAVCNNCGAYAPEVRHDTLAEDQKQAGIESDAAAIVAWNTRAASVRTKDPCHLWQDLTDEEIAQAVGSPLDEVYLADFRAVIAADMEKNK